MIPVIYWSGSGNTERMAMILAEAIGVDAKLLQVSTASESDIEEAEAIAFGCPAMGAEQLEECEFEPYFSNIEAKLKGKKVLLFGSYGWGGSYMTEWMARTEADGAILVTDGILALNEPDDEAAQNLQKAAQLLKQLT